MINLKRSFFAAVLACALSMSAASNSFGQNLILNGDFSSTTATGRGSGVDTSGYTSGATITSWSNQGYTFIFTGTNAGDHSVTGSSGSFSLWGPNNGVSNGLSKPTGYTGNIIASDGVYETGAIYQTVSGLTAGKVYQVSFQWAGAQQQGYDGTTTEGWTVALSPNSYNSVYSSTGGSDGSLVGGQTTVMVSNSNHGFTGWMTQTFDFTATASTETLYFLAQGTPDGEPPISLLANVSMILVPEPEYSSTWTIAFVMLIMAANLVWRRVFKKAPAVA